MSKPEVNGDTDSRELEALLDAAVDAVVIIDQNGIIERVNVATTRIFGYLEQEMVGQNVSILMPAPYRDEHDAYLEHYKHTGQKKIIGIGREVQARHKHGHIFPIDLAVGQTKALDPPRFVGFIRDISERKRTEETLQAQEEELREQRDRLAHVTRLSTMGEMAAGIAHEINQPLTAISTYANACRRMLESDQFQVEQLISVLEKINVQSQRAGNIIRGMRSFAKNKRSDRNAMDCNLLIEDVARLAEVDAKNYDASISLELQDKLPPVVMDGIQIQQVIINLIRNGIEASHNLPCPQIVIKSSQVSEDHIQVSVIDQGEGIPEEKRGEVFNPFFTTKSEGLGMGLSICRSIIQAHGGDLDFRIADNGGTEFYFLLPIAVENE